MRNSIIKQPFNQQGTHNNDEDISGLYETPFIPKNVYDNLPKILMHGSRPFVDDKRKRDVFLTGAITIISGCLPNVGGIYDGETVFPNLYSFIVAPSSSGKGSLKHAKNLGGSYHNHLLEISEGEKVLFIPANASTSKIIQHLTINDGSGILCETEADTLTNTLRQDWGGYSDILRKGFHHERVSLSRRGQNEYAEINEPKLSVALSGTLNQVIPLIPSAEDGLLSRFIFYTFRSAPFWKDVSPQGNPVNLTDYFNELSEIMHLLTSHLERSPTLFFLRKDQWDIFQDKFEKWHDIIADHYDNDSDVLSIVRRMGMITFRIAMIFSSLRKAEEEYKGKEIYCSDVDLNSALILAQVYIDHSLRVYQMLPKHQDNRINEKIQRFLYALPDKFTRAEAIRIGEKIGYKTRSIDQLLKTLLGKYLYSPSHGFYRKIK